MSGWRKFIAYVVAMLIITWLALSHALTGAEFSACFKVCLTVFIAGNVLEHGAKLIKKG